MRSRRMTTTCTMTDAMPR
uniref:Uncharacterized protein n=1 Tax=Arundo donax TaxID=35708 RepID=A0A0A9EVY9_ARUDO